MEGKAARFTTAHRDLALLIVLSLNFGAAFLSRNAVGLVGPYIQHGLALNHTQLGALSAALGLAWAVVGYFGTAIIGNRMDARVALALLSVLNALSLFWSALATSFWSMMASRVVAGAAAGPVMPRSQALIALRSAPENRGRRMGLMQAFGGSLLGAILAPILLIPIANAWGWRLSFGVAGAGCVATALLLWGSRQAFASVATENRAADVAVANTVSTGSVRNLLLCCIVSASMVSWLVITTTFVPTFLVGALGWTAYRMGIAMSGFGVTSMLSAILVPLMSDRIGRRPAVVMCASVGGLAALGICMAGGDDFASIATVMTVGIAGGTFPLFMAAIPAECAPVGRVAAWIALVQGVGEIVGGVVAPVLAGLAADRFGSRAAISMAAACVCAGTLASLFLLETNPRGRRA